MPHLGNAYDEGSRSIQEVDDVARQDGDQAEAPLKWLDQLAQTKHQSADDVFLAYDDH